jgi:hypothetical protein
MTPVEDLHHMRADNEHCGLPALLISCVSGASVVLEANWLHQCATSAAWLTHHSYRVVEDKRKKLHELKAVLDSGIDSEAGLQRLRGSEGRLRADIAAVQALNLQRHKQLMEGGDNEYRKMQQLKEQALKRTRKCEEQETKAARLQAKLATVQAGPQRPTVCQWDIMPLPTSCVCDTICRMALQTCSQTAAAQRKQKKTRCVCML